MMPSRYAVASFGSTSLEQAQATYARAASIAAGGLLPVTATFTTTGGAAAGDSESLLARPCRSFALQVVSDGVTAWTVLLQGSVDGSTWFTLTTHAETDASGTILWATDKPVPYVRANVTTITGGTSLAVSYAGVP